MFVKIGRNYRLPAVGRTTAKPSFDHSQLVKRVSEIKELGRVMALIVRPKSMQEKIGLRSQELPIN